MSSAFWRGRLLLVIFSDIDIRVRDLLVGCLIYGGDHRDKNGIFHDEAIFMMKAFSKRMKRQQVRDVPMFSSYVTI